MGWSVGEEADGDGGGDGDCDPRVIQVAAVCLEQSELQGEVTNWKSLKITCLLAKLLAYSW